MNDGDIIEIFDNNRDYYGRREEGPDNVNIGLLTNYRPASSMLRAF